MRICPYTLATSVLLLQPLYALSDSRKPINPEHPDILCEAKSGVKVEDAMVCAKFLMDSGTTECYARELYPNNLCTHGTALIRGEALFGGHTSSYCRDVGLGLQHIIDTCQVDGEVGGTGLVPGNGDYLLEINGLLRGRFPIGPDYEMKPNPWGDYSGCLDPRVRWGRRAEQLRRMHHTQSCTPAPAPTAKRVD